MTGARILVTGMEDDLGRLVVERLTARADVDLVVGVAGTVAPTVTGVDMVTLPRDYDGITDLVRRHRIDTIVHADRQWTRGGARRNGAAGHVITTMRVAAAAAHRQTAVRSLVMVSSTRVYPVSSRTARLHPESELLQPRRGSLAAALVEAEGYVRDLATTSPNLSASILRLADVAGGSAADPLSALLASPIVPAMWGFDPSVQLLHIDDAVIAIEHAIDRDLAGVYNVGADELLRWRRAVRLTRRPHIDLPLAPTGALNRLLRWPYRATGDDDLVDVLKFGRAAATDAITRSGFRPTSTTAQCVTIASQGRRRDRQVSARS